MKITEKIAEKGFVITLEFNPLKGGLEAAYEEARDAVELADAVNITDMPGAHLHISPWAGGLFIEQKGITSIVQYTTRDRNKLALFGDILGLYELGIRNILLLRGDNPSVGDMPDAMGVFNIDTIGVIRWVKENCPEMCIGAAANPLFDTESEIIRMQKKVEAGVSFFQTQAVFDAEAYLTFLDKARGRIEAPILAGIIPLRSARMAQYMNDNIPGIDVPKWMIEKIASASEKDRALIGKEMAMDTISRIRHSVPGIHLMPIKGYAVAVDIIKTLKGVV